ncbi:glycosyltransferase [Pelotomaculum terephthalicicum JT]|uniref:glycosyltransferase n=1 Tax=Pelotomaculum TaxID=191373 RepID=UPI0009C5154C|nr:MULTISPECIES: glycosyltransferase [Pelotomaculum]MCG9969274.1 glycosyltransferase [Pelotomaculum terephthalicicum JT]OPX89797.1 MAG: hypothetical protein A4E54_00823 [Pelotomaculum sp. PtaB.Bin117]OPY60744.1 MAG: hypothetical protein A4E56_02508 [Pelotomaculum sp. PtaU1.Bin065]
MNLLLVSLAMLAAAGFVFLFRIFFNRSCQTVHKSTRTVVIIVKDQEPWVEGFIRKIFYLIKNTPWIKVRVVDDGSCDKTLEILSCLQRYYPFELLSVKAAKNMESNGDANGFSHTRQFDVRGLAGKDLLRAPLFFHLSPNSAGKFNVLSK